MVRILSPLYVAIPLYLQHVSAAPLDLAIEEFNTGADATCSGDQSVDFDPNCWLQLDMDNWLPNWYNSMPKCTGSGSSNTCCNSRGRTNETWAACFIRTNTLNAAYRCDLINVKACELEGFDIPADLPDRAQRRYALWAIYSMNSFFNNWYFAMDGAKTDAGLKCQAIINALIPAKKQNMVLNDVLGAFSIGLSIIAAPITPVLSIVQRIATNSIISSIVNTPAVGRLVWPIHSDDAAQVQVANLQTYLLSISSQLSNRLQGGLAMALSDLPSFLNMTRGGAYSTQEQFSLPNSTAALSSGITTYLLSLAIQNNGWETYVGPVMTDGLNSTPQSRSANYGCDMQSNGVCAYNGKGRGKMQQPTTWAEYTSTTLNRSFTVHAYFQDKESATRNPADLLSKITSQNWGDLELLFASSFNCTQTRNAVFQESTTPVVLGPRDDGTLDTSCVSRLNMVTGCFRISDTWADATGRMKKCGSFFNAYS